MRVVVKGLAWMSGLVVVLFLGLTAIVPAAAWWEDLVFLGAPVLLLPHLLTKGIAAIEIDRWWCRLPGLFARVAILAFVALLILLIFRGGTSNAWMLGLVVLTLAAGPAIAGGAAIELRASRINPALGWCGIVSGVLWTVLLAMDLAGGVQQGGWIGLLWILMHGIYAFSLAARGRDRPSGDSSGDLET